MGRTPFRRAAAIVAAALLVAACGDDDTTTTADDVDRVESLDNEEVTDTTETGAETTTTVDHDHEADAPADGGEDDGAPVEGPAADADQVIEVEVSGGQVTGGGRHRVALGDTVALVVTSDVDDEIHVHGYDIHGDLTAGGTATVTFDADIPGVFEVELHDSGLGLVELEIS